MYFHKIKLGCYDLIGSANDKWCEIETGCLVLKDYFFYFLGVNSFSINRVAQETAINLLKTAESENDK